MARLRSANNFIVLVQTTLTNFATIQSLVTTAAFTLPRESSSPTRRLLTTIVAKQTPAHQPFSLSSSVKSIKRCRLVATEIRRFGELQKSSEATTAAAAAEDDPDDLLRWERMYQQGER